MTVLNKKIRFILIAFTMISLLISGFGMVKAAQTSGQIAPLSVTVSPNVENYQKERAEAIKSFLNDGKTFFKKENYSDAKVMFEKVLKIDPNNSEASDFVKKCDLGIKGLPVKEVKPVVKPVVKKDDSAAKLAREQAEKERQAKIAADKQAKAKADADRQAQLEAEKKAAADKAAAEKAAKEQAEKDRQAKIAADKQAKAKADADRQAQLEAEKKAAADKVAAEKAAKEQVEKDRQAKIAADKDAKIKAEAEKKAQLEAQKKAAADKEAAKAQAEKEAKARAEAEKKAAAEKLAAEKAAKSKVSSDNTAKQQAENERQAKIAAEKEAQIRAEAERKAKLEAEKKAAADKAAAEKAARIQAEKDRQAKIAADKQAIEKMEADKAAKAQAEKTAKARAEAERKAKIEAEKKAAEDKIAAEKAAKVQAENERQAKIAADKQAKEKMEADKAAKEQAEKAAKAKAEADRKAKLEAEKKAAEDKMAVEKAAKIQAENERQAKIAADKQAKEKMEADKAAKEQAEKAAKAKAEADRKAKLEADKESKAKAEANRQAQMEAEKKAAEDKIAAEKAAKAQAENERQAKIAAEKQAKEKMEADKAAKEQAEKEVKVKAEADRKAKIEAEKKAAADKEAAKKAEEERLAKIEQDKKASDRQAKLEKEQQQAQEKAAREKIKEEARIKKQAVSDRIAAGKKLYASSNLDELAKAETEFQSALAIEPNNAEAVKYLDLTRKKIESIKEKESKKIEVEVVQPRIVETPVQDNGTPAADTKVTTTTPVAEQPAIVSPEEKARQDQVTKAEEDEKRFRIEKERETAANNAKNAEIHYTAGVTYMNQSQIIKAHEEWNKALELVPTLAKAKVMIEETRADYEKALDAQRKQEELARVEGENDKRMQESIITIDVTDQEIGDVLTQMGAVAGFNVVIGEGVKAKISASFTNVSLKKALDTLLPLHGFKYNRQGDIIQVAIDLKSRVIPLTDDQVQKLHYAMIEDKILQRQLYGPDAKPKVSGQELILDERAHIITITDSAINIAKLDEFLQNLPAVRPDELVTKTYTIRQGSSEEIRKLVQSIASANPVKGVPDEERKVILESGSNTLVIRDSAENIKKIEDFMMDKNFLDKLTNQDLIVKVFHLSPEENVMTPESLARKAELVNNVAEVLETMLYAAEGREKAYESGRRIFKDPRYGTITVVDSQDNLGKIENYVSQLPTGQDQKMLSKVFQIKNADPENLRNVINQIIQESRSSGGGGASGSYVTGVITVGAGNGLVFLDCTVELIEVTGDTTTPQARLYVYTPIRDREVTLSKGNSELIDQYRVRVVTADKDRQEAEIEVRLAQNQSTQNSVNNYNPNQYNTNQTGGPDSGFGTPSQANPNLLTNQATPQVQAKRPTLKVDKSTNNLIVLAYDPADLQMIEEWISKLDVPILQVTIEAKFVEVSETKAKKFGVDWVIPSLSNWGSMEGVNDQVTFGRNNGSSADPAISSGGTDPIVSDLRNNNLMSGGTLLKFATVGGFEMSLEALEAEGVLSVINSPRVTALNGERAILEITQQIPYLSFDVSSNQVSATWNFDSVGIRLEVTPTIHADGSVILTIKPTVDKLVSRLPMSANVFPSSVYSLSANVMEKHAIGVPVIDRRRLETRARVSDGGTIVLGGLIQENEKTSESKVPILGDIPFLKYFFKRSLDYTDKNRLFIFLTATVVP